MSQQSKELSIWQHLDELRKRLLFSIISLVVGVLISTFFTNFLLQLVAEPIGGLENLLSLQVAENLSVYFRVSLLSGFIISLPFIIIQLYFFISPGLLKNERRWLIATVPVGTLLFLAGAAFGYLVMLPTAIPFLVEFPGPNVLPKWKDYVNFVTSILFWIGLSFEAPLLMFILARLGIINTKLLITHWQYALVIIAVIAAVVTPTPDPINMAILMTPLIALYILGILFTAIAQKQRNKKE